MVFLITSPRRTSAALGLRLSPGQSGRTENESNRKKGAGYAGDNAADVGMGLSAAHLELLCTLAGECLDGTLSLMMPHPGWEVRRDSSPARPGGPVVARASARTRARASARDLLCHRVGFAAADPQSTGPHP